MSKVLVKNEVLTLGYGNQTLNGKPYYHNGIDLVGEGMSACHIKALMSGHVVDKGYQANGYGNYIVIDHENGYETRYGHMADPADVNIGDHVEEGQVFGYMGATGYAFGVHLHFEIISGALGFATIDPTDYIFGDKKLPNKPEPQPEPKKELAHKFGEKVRVSSYYASSTDGVEKAVHREAVGTITKVLENGCHNPYLLDNGNIGWCNDGDIREVIVINKKSLQEVADEIYYKGKYGQGLERKQALAREGYTDEEINQIQILLGKYKY